MFPAALSLTLGWQGHQGCALSLVPPAARPLHTETKDALTLVSHCCSSSSVLVTLIPAYLLGCL